MLHTFFDWYHQQTPKDQQVLKLGVVAVITGILYFALLNPLIEGRKQLSSDVLIAEKNLQYLKQSASSLKNVATNNNSSRLSASQIASTSANKFSVTLARIVPKRKNQTALTIESAQFNQLISWLSEIQKLGLAIETIDISQLEQTGYVKANITVSGGAG